MKQISLRKAGKSDYDDYKKLYDKYDFLYKIDFEDGPKQEEKSKQILQELGINTAMLKDDEESFRKSFENNLKSIFIIEVENEISGYMRISRTKKSIKISEMSISDYSIINELYLLKIIHCLFQETKAEIIWLIVPNENVKKMFCRIGFEKRLCHIEKRA